MLVASLSEMDKAIVMIENRTATSYFTNKVKESKDDPNDKTYSVL